MNNNPSTMESKENTTDAIVNETTFMFANVPVQAITRVMTVNKITHTELWVSGSNICDIISIKNHSKAYSKLDDHEKILLVGQTKGGPQLKIYINESGLYSIVLRSKKPEAKKFKQWITQELRIRIHIMIL